jgi:predicted metal-dependent hydrolase
VSPCEHHGILPRRVAFGWWHAPLRRISGEPTATHLLDVLHALQPAGERQTIPRYVQRSCPPSREGSMRRVTACPERSPVARRAS